MCDCGKTRAEGELPEEDPDKTVIGLGARKLKFTLFSIPDDDPPANGQEPPKKARGQD